MANSFSLMVDAHTCEWGLTLYHAIRNDSQEVVDFEVCYQNAAACRLFQMSPESVFHQCMTDLLPNDTGTHLNDILINVFATGQPQILLFEPNTATQPDSNYQWRVTFEIYGTDNVLAVWHPVTAGADTASQIVAHLASQSARSRRPSFVLDAQHNFIFFNASWLFHRKSTLAKELSCQLSDIIHPDDISGVFSDLLCHLHPPDSEPKHKEFRVLTPDGDFRWISGIVTPAYTHANTYCGCSVYCTAYVDKAQERHAEIAAVRLAAIVSTADAGFIIKDCEGLVTDWNIGAENILGFTKAEIVGHSTKACAPVETHKSLEEIHERILQGEHIGHVELVLMHKDGRHIACSVSYTPTRDQHDVITGSIAIFLDITEKKNAERLQKQAEEDLKRAYLDTAAILHEIPAPICVVSKVSGCILSSNGAFAAMCGSTSTDLLTDTPLTNYCKQSKAASRTSIAKRMELGASFKCTIKKIDGTLIEVEVFSRPFVYQQQPAFAIYCVDLTAQRQQQQALLHAAKQAEQASRMKSVFLANMSHEIRTPMNGVIGFAELAMDDATLSIKARDYLHKISLSANSLLDIINNVLDISKIEAGKIELDKTPFTLHDIFLYLETITKPKAAEKGVHLYFYAEPQISRILLGDPTKLRQILLNLITNAIKFTSTGMVKLMATLQGESSSTLTINFEVKDSGIGMTDDQVKRIFDPFTQGDDSTTRRYGGSGLGLTISKSLVELMGGQLSVQSVIGIGSKFSFTLRFDTTEASAIQPIQKVTMSHLERPTFTGSVLVCEDNALNQQVILEHLTRIGLSVTIAENGRLGVDLVATRHRAGKPYDIILMDIHMPVMDGLEATQLMLNMGIRTPIVAMTANVLSKERENYIAQGMSDYIGKPFNAIELWNCLARFLTPIKRKILPLQETITADVSLLSVDKDIIDTRLGIERTASDIQLYHTILTGFVKDQRGVVLAIRSNMEAGLFKEAHRAAHSLKSVSAMIGAERLKESALAVETVLRHEELVSEQQMKLLESRLQEVLMQILPLMKAPKTTAHLPQPLDVPKALALVERVATLLSSGDSQSIDHLDELSALATLGDRYRTLVAQMTGYDFDLAYETILGIKTDLEALL